MCVCVYVCVYVCMYVCMYVISEHRVERVDRLRIGAHYSSSFCPISATEFKLLFPPPFENLVLNFPQFCENQLHPRKVHLPIVSQISLREREGGGERNRRRGGREEGEEGKRGRKGGGKK